VQVYRLADSALVFAAAALCAALFAASSAHAATYKWVDDQGIVHYTDKIPLEAVNKGNTELNKQGLQVKKNDAALTPEQRRAKELEDERQKLLVKQREDVERRDRALLNTYTTEGEIDLARSRALTTIDSQIVSAQAYTTQLSKRKLELEQRKTALGDKPVPAVIERELGTIDTELEKQNELMSSKKKEAALVTARYDADKQRWHELRLAAEVSNAARANSEASNATRTNGNAARAANVVPAVAVPPTAKK
jgi:hypothetical protein